MLFMPEALKEAVEVHYGDLLEKGEDIKILSISETEVHPFVKAASD